MTPFGFLAKRLSVLHPHAPQQTQSLLLLVRTQIPAPQPVQFKKAG